MRNTDEFRNPRARIEEDWPLIDQNVARELRDRWNTIQNTFIDQPRKAVDEANRVIEELMQHLADAFANERSRLERPAGQQGREPVEPTASTEDMRLALQRRRSIFTKLVSM